MTSRVNTTCQKVIISLRAGTVRGGSHKTTLGFDFSEVSGDLLEALQEV